MAKKDSTKESTISTKMQDMMKALSAKFPPEKVRTRKGAYNKAKGDYDYYDYIPAHEIIDRLNDVFGLNWSAYEMESHFIGQDYIVKRVRIEVTDSETGKSYIKDGWAGQKVQGPEISNAFKGAYTKAFSKAASCLGVGLYLWGVDSDEEEAEAYSEAPVSNLPPNVTVVNPGMHNPVVAPTVVMPGRLEPNMQPGQINSAPPVPQVPWQNNNVPERAPSVPQFVNPSVGNVAPPQNNNPAPPPLPVFANPNVDPGFQGAGITSGPGTAATASINFPAAASSSDPAPIEVFQINGIRAAAGILGMPDPMHLVYKVLGNEAQGIQTINQLTAEQAERVMEAAQTTGLLS